MVVRSHYQSVDLQAIGARFAEGLREAETQQLEGEVEDAAKKLAGDIDLFGETSGNGEAQWSAWRLSAVISRQCS